MALRNEIRVDPGAHLAGAVRVLFGKTDPFDCGMAGRHLAAEQAHAAASDDRKSDTPGRLFHWFTPARIFCLNSAMAEIVSFDSGRSTGSFRSADRSAAL